MLRRDHILSVPTVEQILKMENRCTRSTSGSLSVRFEYERLVRAYGVPRRGVESGFKSFEADVGSRKLGKISDLREPLPVLPSSFLPFNLSFLSSSQLVITAHLFSTIQSLSYRRRPSCFTSSSGRRCLSLSKVVQGCSSPCNPS